MIPEGDEPLVRHGDTFAEQLNRIEDMLKRSLAAQSAILALMGQPHIGQQITGCRVEMNSVQMPAPPGLVIPGR